MAKGYTSKLNDLVMDMDNKQQEEDKTKNEETKNEEVKDVEAGQEQPANEEQEQEQTENEVENDDEKISINEYEKQKSMEFVELTLEKTKKEKVTDTHTRFSTFLANDLITRLDKISKKQPRGFKQAFINTAVEDLLDKFEKAIEEEERRKREKKQQKQK